ncbi:UNVERIFIED_CONTAM: hypothetical protein NCL1_35352 [Trichonephila clavipes]
MGLDEWNSWFKSRVRDSNRSQDIKKQPYEQEIIITGRADREGSNEPDPNGLSGSGAEMLAKKL